MKNFIKLVRSGSILALIGGVIYLASEGDLGVNMATIGITATPTTLVILTGLYDLFQIVFPKVVVAMIWKKAVDTIGQENADVMKSTITQIGAPKLFEAISQFLIDFSEVKDTVLAIKEKQDDVM